MMNDGFSFDSSITCFEVFRISWVNLGYIAGDRRQNLKTKLLRYLSKTNIPTSLTSSCRASLNRPRNANTYCEINKSRSETDLYIRVWACLPSG